jgi:RimJ/RimL family protein N-acetyltransferase
MSTEGARPRGIALRQEKTMQLESLELPTHIETERLTLRSFQPGDGPMYLAAGQKNRAHLERYESDNAILSIHTEEDAEALVRDLAAEWAAGHYYFIGAFDKKTQEFVAQVFIGLVNRDLPEFQIGYFVDKDHEGQGYVTEAVTAALGFIFEHLKAHRVRLECDDTNVRSYRVAERCNMVREGYLRQNHKNPDGTFTGTLVYGLLKDEFEQLKLDAR